MTPTRFTVVALFVAAEFMPLRAAPVSTAFTYQGQLRDEGAPTSGEYDMWFTLFDAGSGGNAVAGPLYFDGGGGNAPPVPVTNGLFTVELDFGSVFDGRALWLQLQVRPHAFGGFTTLAPRQPLTATPFAAHSLDNQWSESGGQIHNSNGGNVGIGTADPAAKLHVAGDIRSDGPAGVIAHNPNDPRAVAMLGWFNDVARIRIGGAGPGSSSGLDIQKTGDRSLMRIYDSGNVWIRGSLDIGYQTVWNSTGFDFSVTRFPVLVANCPAGKTVISGGCAAYDGSAVPMSSVPNSPTQWFCQFYPALSSGDIHAYAVCANLVPDSTTAATGLPELTDGEDSSEPGQPVLLDVPRARRGTESIEIEAMNERILQLERMLSQLQAQQQGE